MESIKAISKATELVPQDSDKLSLTTGLGTSLSATVGLSLLLLMKQTRDRYATQVITEGTAEMYLAEWAESAQKYGMEAFRVGLLKVIRDSTFFPAPELIEAECRSVRHAENERANTVRILREDAERKAIWERERAEDLANGRQYTEQELRLDAILKAEGERKDRARYVHVPPMNLSPQEVMEMVSRERAE